MSDFGRAVVRGAGMLLIALSVGNVCASEFTDKAERAFSSIESVSETGSTGKVSLKVPNRMPDYYESGDKANKVFAIDSVRVFRDVPKLNRLVVTIPREDKVQTLNVTRAQVEQHYDLRLTDLAANSSSWRESFIQPYDNKQSRADFVKKFVTEK